MRDRERLGNLSDARQLDEAGEASLHASFRRLRLCPQRQLAQGEHRMAVAKLGSLAKPLGQALEASVAAQDPDGL
jgi:hypothetical protein